MWHIQAVGAKCPPEGEDGCVRLEVNVDASGVAAQIPDAFGDTTFGDVREACKGFGGWPALTTHRECPSINEIERALHQLLLLQLQDVEAALTWAEDDITEAIHFCDC
jgi:hypothetical protein